VLLFIIYALHVQHSVRNASYPANLSLSLSLTHTHTYAPTTGKVDVLDGAVISRRRRRRSDMVCLCKRRQTSSRLLIDPARRSAYSVHVV